MGCVLLSLLVIIYSETHMLGLTQWNGQANTERSKRDKPPPYEHVRVSVQALLMFAQNASYTRNSAPCLCPPHWHLTNPPSKMPHLFWCKSSHCHQQCLNKIPRGWCCA
ncbi:hypothetical protein JKP88DRAFT_219630 [Tribonema minus]|uniref:Secreted protein n=1 Tax=Tribonema minus TaxID=303371 RepID=A0A835YZF4_9STRA|nr:hypothetical protein JKP88DRAFT_219630 [Tribonema minus]